MWRLMFEGCGFYLNHSLAPPLIVQLWQFRKTASEGFHYRGLFQKRGGDWESPLQRMHMRRGDGRDDRLMV